MIVLNRLISAMLHICGFVFKFVLPHLLFCLLIFPCIIKSRSSLLAPAHPGGPGKRAVKRLWCGSLDRPHKSLLDEYTVYSVMVSCCSKELIILHIITVCALNFVGLDIFGEQRTVVSQVGDCHNMMFIDVRR